MPAVAVLCWLLFSFASCFGSPAFVLRPEREHSHGNDCVAHITYVTPRFSPLSGGGGLTVLGHGFERCGAVSITIANASAADFRLVSDTRLVATVPAAFAALPGEMLSVGGHSDLAVHVAFRPRSASPFVLTYGEPFTYFVPPPDLCPTAVRSVSPAVSPVRGGGSAVLTGVGFQTCAGVLSVKIGPFKCMDFSVESDTRLLLRSVPAASRALAGLTVTVTFFDGSTVQLDDAFAYADFLSSAQVTPDGLRLVLTFDLPTTMAEDCADIFVPTTLHWLGEAPSCSWRSEESLLVTPGPGASISVGDSVAVHGSLRRASPDGPQLLPPGGWSVPLAGPTSPVVPAVVWSVSGAVPKPSAALPSLPPYFATLCDDVVIDASFSFGDAGRPLSASWSHSLGRTDAVASGLVLRLSRDALRGMPTPRWVDVSLTLHNWLGAASAVQTLKVFVDAARGFLDYPRVRLPVAYHAVAGADVWLSGEVHPSGCAPLGPPPSVYWQPVGKQPSSLVVASSLRVATSSLLSPARFALLFNATYGNDVVPVVLAETTIVVQKSSQHDVLRIDGGDVRSVPRAAGSFVLQLAPASSGWGGSRDLDREQVEWRCLAAEGTKSCDDSVRPLKTSLSSGIVVDTSAGENGLSAGEYTFVAQRRSKLGAIESSASVRILVAPGSGPSIALGISAPNPAAVNSGEPLLLEGRQISSLLDVHWRWSSSSPELSFLSTSTSPSVIVPAGTLRPGREYTIRLEATAAGVTAVAMLRFSTAPLPFGGTLEVVPHEQGQFSFEAPGWHADGGVSTYEFAAWALDPDGTQRRPILHEKLSGHQLPAVALPDGKIVVGVTVSAPAASVTAEVVVVIKHGRLLESPLVRRAVATLESSADVQPTSFLASASGFLVVFAAAAAVLVVRQRIQSDVTVRSPLANKPSTKSWQTTTTQLSAIDQHWLSRGEPSRAQQDAAATTIQAAARGFLTRSRFLRQHQAFWQGTQAIPIISSEADFKLVAVLPDLDLLPESPPPVDMPHHAAEITHLLQSIDEILAESSDG
eukprot:TRINITY_DN7298_c0_g1_i1.p1 TRINITY_DN7298_c0_g1~~TRINITY_DN7298_c0_g1_i1.p1  ORF type:complete len:1037 (+),score=186.75 TRINITY_DN7298_c0_g1_i1:150-3260(+)